MGPFPPFFFCNRRGIPRLDVTGVTVTTAAVSMMKRDGKPIKPFSKEEVDNILKANGVKLENNELYDHVFVANMGKADYLGKSIANEKYLAMYIKDVIDDEDGYDGLPFNRWYADMCKKGKPIDWNEYL